MKKALICFFILGALLSISMAQEMNLSKNWEELGPVQKPDNSYGISAAGIGPVEFLRVNTKRKGYMLTGSLKGGLFYTLDGGENWKNAGSDNWPFSGCPWADYYPEDEQIWFAVSHQTEESSKPGMLGDEGGIYRTVDEGLNWQKVFIPQDVGQSKYLKIYGTRFSPVNPQRLFVMTSNGLYYTDDCLTRNIYWKNVPNIQGWVYDLDYLDGYWYVCNFYKNKWNVIKVEATALSNQMAIKDIENDKADKRTITIEPRKNNLLVLMDYQNAKDNLMEYFVKQDSLAELISNQRVNFGSGHTFAVAPHNPDLIYVGNSTRVRKFNYSLKKKVFLNTGYHVDVEFIAFDPFDSTKVFFCTHGGVYQSPDQGVNWESISNGIGIAEIYGLSVSPTNYNQIAIGTYHDGSSLRSDFDQNGKYYWRTVNGGDGLISIVHPTDPNIIYTSNQYTGGGFYYSKDSAKTNVNLHNQNGLATSGWEMAAALHPIEKDVVYFNFKETNAFNKDNINLCRSNDHSKRNTAEILTDFKSSHQLQSYKVYGVYNDKAYPNELYVYVLHYTKDANGKKRTNHLIFKCDNITDQAKNVISNWVKIEHPENTWVADVARNPTKPNELFVTYTSGYSKADAAAFDKRMIYLLKFNGQGQLKRAKDISKNLPNADVGKFNLVVDDANKGSVFIATRTGVYYGNHKMLKGRSKWKEIGTGLPHLKVYGLIYNPLQQVLTVGYDGRGVWQYHLYD
jgi:hypothetical protein